MSVGNKFISSPLRAGAVLAFMSILIFLVTYAFFKQADYFYSSVLSSAFIMPLLYAIFAVMVAYVQSTKHQELSLLQSFGWPFLTLCTGGILSLAAIFLFFNFIDPQAENLLKKGIFSYWFERNKAEMVQTYGLQAYKQRVKAIDRNTLFNIWSFFLYVIFCFFYYFVLSLLIGLFFRKHST
ncbi:DUF4199 domain-containing protein [Bacteroidetes bacterium endosymbiont of Geopemphigus sp.]|uniref:DUF4199 domain-containing protein n=1 Tax=Bacteroidetes bacterium endosymbiont of Geopemphigus sp. TaxID=2047937 RepID=UPI000CD1B2A0|nr:DUF4199 domain-containing protein [Bacteroidetes bacterium endosymbiont of Geopemphigus sp.]